MFAIQNAGNISWQAYRQHKIVSIIITAVVVGIGCYLVQSASAAGFVVEAGSKIALQQAAKGIAVNTFWAAVKKVIYEVGKAAFNAATSVLVDQLANLCTSIDFEKFKDWIVKGFQLSPVYHAHKSSMESTFMNLQETLQTQPSPATLMETITHEKFTEAEA
jgi:hypothetical protein